MTKRLVEAGYHVTGFDVSEEARARVERFGVRVVDQLKEAVVHVDVLVLMLPDSNAVEAVLRDPELQAELSKDTVVVDMSSSEPLRTRALAESMARQGIRLSDAPVSGGVAGATDGRLTIMVGGSPEAVEDIRTLLEVLGKVVHAGPVGSGHAVKALNNLLSATHLLSTSEAILAGERFGLDAEMMLAVFNGSSGRSGSTENKWPNFILPESYNSGFGLQLMLKDMRIAVQLATEEGAPCELGKEAVALWTDAARELAPTADHTEIARWLRIKQGESTS